MALADARLLVSTASAGLTKSKSHVVNFSPMLGLAAAQRVSRAFSEDGVRAGLRPAAAAYRRSLVAAGLLAIILLAVGLRLVPIIFVPSVNWGDEIFQAIEPAHRLVYGYGLVPWEFQLGM